MAVQATVGLSLTATETSSLVSATLNVVHNLFNVAKTLNGTTSPAVTKCAYSEVTLSGGAATINLAALTGTNGGSVDLTGAKVQALIFKNKASNANDMTITVGASNGYDLLGASMNVTLKPGQSILMDLANVSPTVGSSDRTIDVAGTGSQVLQVGVIG